ncbi:TRAP transporter small permease [Nocardia sp. NPDC050718]|uniref:TRAP transporter small permease n=1 Tax=Nocardia sp. NPDC050718 TaxID=3155788 RepID=UPI0033F1BF46
MKDTTTIVHPDRRGRAERTPFGYLTAEHPTLDRVQNMISAVSAVIAGVSIVAMVLITLADVVARSLFESPLGWSVSFIEMYLLTAAAFFGIVTAYRSGAHIAVVSLFNRTPPRGQKLLMIFAYLVVLVGLCALGWAGLMATVFAVEISEGPVPGSSELPIPGWLMWSIVPVSTGLGVILVVIDLARELFSPWDRTATDYDPGDFGAEEDGRVVLGAESGAGR